MNAAVRKTRTSRTSRKSAMRARSWKPALVGAAAVATLLTSTACESDKKEGSADGKGADRPSASGAQKPGDSASSKPGGTTGGTGTGDDNGSGNGNRDGSGGGNNADGALAVCKAEHLAVSTTKEPADSKDARHLLITVQNSGETKCNVWHHPFVKIGDSTAPTTVIKDSNPDPGKPVTLAPGDEAHAALLVAGGGMDEYEADTVSLTLQGSTPGSTEGSLLDIPLPVDKLYADDGQRVTYWTTASGSALDFIMDK